ncbi:MAG: MBOAT family O-acyltransferase [Candidatus Omnitrophota bacterium]|jgi:D-alanyl-lipoteichoic acid acyltransferase DltB (MBOAT superfamily)
MPFTSLQYFLFLPLVYLVFYFVGDRARWFVLLAASFLFYAALNVPYLLVVLMLVVVTSYGFGIWLNQASAPKTKRALLWSGIAANILILVVMKYLPFLSTNLKALTTLLSVNAQIQPVKAFVAIGVSYYVFSAISYLINVYLEIVKPERHFGYFTLYMAFFPKLLQGPIERAENLLPQLKAKYEFNYDNMRSGMLLFAWGLFKKVVIADRLGLYVDAVYNNVHSYTGLPLLLATYAYAFQIYLDFSGYTDMALGSARLFNINLTQNFNSPYTATSVADFWRRWHISFSSWILDYIFKPLQMQWRNGRNWGTAAALIVTFLVSGIWHGAGWGFVIWGLLHGLYLACSVFCRPYQKKLHQALGIEKTRPLEVWQIFVTFNLVCLAWIVFRGNSLEDAWYITTHLFTNSNMRLIDSLLAGQSLKGFIVTLGSIVFLLVAHYLLNGGFQITAGDFGKHLSMKPVWFRWNVYYAIMFFILIFGIFDNAQPFIYFQF